TAYEQDMARGCYAYGVDIRRGSWFGNSAVAQTAMRSLELRWLQLGDELMASGELLYPEDPRLVGVLSEIVALAGLLHADVPGLRLLSDKARSSGNWSVVTPLGNTRGTTNWLAVDAEALLAQSPAQRRFLLGSALGHLQCGHGILFTSRVITVRDGGLGLTARLLRPWTKVAVFSADRAGMLAAGELDASLMAVAAETSSQAAYLPEFPEYSIRRRALEDFDHTRVVARMRTQRSLLTERAGRAIAGAQLRAKAAEKGAEASEAEPTDSEPASSEAESTEAESTATGDDNRGVPRSAWPVARCDQRLTRRLGLL
ncbi:MAG: hypothetical protein ACPG77_05190, partial [Nannocystaceae bacterium]